ncbi:MAG: serine hydrolase [Parvularcula sp.]|jgi:CubicO group peptidase (beta-lactamase class C family)|nr:serine hydrolase [Parvularcula sp.]
MIFTRRLGVLLAFTLAACATQEPSFLPSTDAPNEAAIPAEWRAKRIIDDTVIEEGVPSISVAAVIGDGPIWSYASGVADKASSRPATPDTAYRLASVSKPFTAVAVAILADRGVIDLDRPANDYLGAVKVEAVVGDPALITPRNLMSHRAGLPFHYNLIHQGEDRERRSLDDTIALYGKAMIRPGVTHRYSNVGYAVLERIIEIQSGMSYAEFLQTELFAPLGMTTAGVLDGPRHPDGSALPYTRDGEPYPAYDLDTRGAGALYMSASDLVRFGRFFRDALGGRSSLLSAEAAQAMLEPMTPYNEGDMEWYVNGWVHELRGADRKTDTIYHLGSTPGARAELFIDPAGGRVVATLVNEMNYTALFHAREAVLASIAPEIGYAPFPKPALPERFAGVWQGTSDLGAHGPVPVRIDAGDVNDLKVRVNGQPLRVVNAWESGGGYVTLETEGMTLPNEDVSRQPTEFLFEMEVFEGRIIGYMAANRRPQRLWDSGAFAFPLALSRAE